MDETGVPSPTLSNTSGVANVAACRAFERDRSNSPRRTRASISRRTAALLGASRWQIEIETDDALRA